MRIKIRRLIIFISFFCLPITLVYISPVIIIQDSFKGIVCGALIVYGVIFSSSLFLGRLYCSWLCPCGGLQDCLSCLNLKKAKNNKRNYIKYFVWFAWLAMVVYAAVLAGGYHTIRFFGHTQNGVSLITMPGAMAYPMYYFIFTLVILFSVILGQRSFCHYVCWLAPFVVIGSKIGQAIHLPTLHIEVEPEKCVHCKKCNAACPMSLEVECLVQTGSLRHSECILCGECKADCPKKVFKYKFGRPKKEPFRNIK